MSTLEVILIIVGVIVVLATIGLLIYLPKSKELRRKHELEERDNELEERRKSVAQSERVKAEREQERAEEAEREARQQRAYAELHAVKAERHEKGLADDELVDEKGNLTNRTTEDRSA